MIELLSQPESWISLLTLTALEIVLGLDNIVFISILTGKLPEEQQDRVRRIGLLLAMVMRVLLLFSISFVMGLKATIFTVGDFALSWRDVVLLAGGLFLVGNSTHEIYQKLEIEGTELGEQPKLRPVRKILFQIVILDIVFSLDSVITAVGMAEHLAIMVAAVVIAVGVMLAFASPIGDFVNRRPSMKILALSFLMLVGVMLVAEGMHQHINRGYIYFAMGYSLLVEVINMRMNKPRQKPLQLHDRYETLPPV